MIIEPSRLELIVSTWGPKRVLGFALLTALIAALVGSILGLGLGIVHWSGELFSAAAVGSLFGGLVGLIGGLLFGLIRKLRDLGSASVLRTILVFAFLGAMAGALILSPFSEGLLMMLTQACEGAMAGALVGGILGTIIRVFWQARMV